VIAYKFLRDGARGPYTGFAWSPDTWVRADGASVCERGVHACRAGELPYWIAEELWEIELAGEIVEGGYKVAASEGRLVRRLEGWDASARRALAEACAGRARGLTVNGDPRVAGLVGDVEACATAGLAAPACYLSALLAERASGADARRAERAAQAAWFAEHVL